MKTKNLIYTLVFVLIIHCTLNNDICSAQWQPDVRLTNDTAGSWISSNNAWSVAASGNVVHVVWKDFRNVNDEIYYKRSTDGGVSWGADTRLTNNAATPWYYSVTVSGSVVHVLWQDIRDGNYEIYYKRSTDAGVSWGADTRLTNNTAESWAPSAAVSGSVVHVLWQDIRDGNYEIYCKRSTDAGVSWGADTRLTNNISDSYYPSVTASGPVVHVVWEDFRDGNWEIYYKRSIDAGINWGADTRLTNNSSNSEDPCVAISGSVVNIVWDEYRDSNYEIYYKRSTDAGVSWEADTRLTENNAESRYPSVAASGLGVNVVWEDFRDGNWEIYYKRSTDAGVSWSSDTRLTNNAAVSYLPTVAVSGSVVHVVWEDSRDGNAEIYYKRNPTGNPTGIQNISSEVPSSYSLSQNYPNPFNPTTNIRYAIPNNLSSPQSETRRLVGRGGDLVQLKVFDELGREVQTLVNEKQSAGTYEVSFDGSKLNSGVYFYRLSSGDFKSIKKMVMIK